MALFFPLYSAHRYTHLRNVHPSNERNNGPHSSSRFKNQTLVMKHSVSRVAQLEGNYSTSSLILSVALSCPTLSYQDVTVRIMGEWAVSYPLYWPRLCNMSGEWKLCPSPSVLYTSYLLMLLFFVFVDFNYA